MQAELEPRRDAEVAAAAAERPRAARRSRPALRGRRDPSGVTSSAPTRLSQVRPCCAVRWPMPPPSVSPRDAGGADDASGRDEAERLRRGVEVEPGRAAFARARSARRRRPRPRRISERSITSPSSTDAVPGRVVPAAAHRDLELVRAREVERGRDVARAAAARDHRGPAVDERVEADAGRVVPGVAGDDAAPASDAAARPGSRRQRRSSAALRRLRLRLRRLPRPRPCSACTRPCAGAGRRSAAAPTAKSAPTRNATW